MTVNCFIVDDERLARRHLARLLKEHADLIVSGEAANGIDAIERISEARPDVLFLDIEMPGLNGFDMLAQIAMPPLVVFTTAFDEYAVRAFDASAIDYLLKPIQASRLAQAVDKIRKQLEHPRLNYRAELQQALSTLRPGPPAKLAGRRGKRIILLAPRDVIHISLEDEISFLHTAAERFASDQTISQLERMLAGGPFVRVSRSAIVNLHYARELVPWSSGTWRIRLANGLEIGVSRERARRLKSVAFGTT